MRKRIACPIVLAVGLLLPGFGAKGSGGESEALKVSGGAEFEECVAAFYSGDADERLRAVRELSGWALDSELREDALGLLRLARYDSERKVAVQAEVGLASLTGGDREAVRAAYGIVTPDARELAIRALEAESSRERLQALTALGRWHRGSGIDTLLAAARDPAAAVRMGALELLSEISAEGGAPELVLEAFVRATTDPDPVVRAFAVSVVRSLR